jgi:hypothetical protein
MRGVLALVPSRTPKAASKPLWPLRGAAVLPRAWHLLSFDAPTVAATWCVAFLTASGAIEHNPAWYWSVVFLSLATWLCYVGDRVLDAFTESELRARHHFYGRLWRERRIPLLGAVSLAVLACSATALTRISGALLAAYAGLTLVALLYFAWLHSAPARAARALAKEAAVASIFALGCLLPTWSIERGALAAWFIPAGALFAQLCWLNCVAIERWEGGGVVSAEAHPSTHWAARRLAALLWFGVIASVTLAELDRRDRSAACLASCLAVAFALLALLERTRRRWSSEALRILADAALLTPLGWWLGARLMR